MPVVGSSIQPQSEAYFLGRTPVRRIYMRWFYLFVVEFPEEFRRIAIDNGLGPGHRRKCENYGQNGKKFQYLIHNVAL